MLQGRAVDLVLMRVAKLEEVEYRLASLDRLLLEAAAVVVASAGRVVLEEEVLIIIMLLLTLAAEGEEQTQVQREPEALEGLAL